MWAILAYTIVAVQQTAPLETGRSSRAATAANIAVDTSDGSLVLTGGGDTPTVQVEGDLIVNGINVKQQIERCHTDAAALDDRLETLTSDLDVKSEVKQQLAGIVSRIDDVVAESAATAIASAATAIAVGSKASDDAVSNLIVKVSDISGKVSNLKTDLEKKISADEKGTSNTKTSKDLTAALVKLDALEKLLTPSAFTRPPSVVPSDEMGSLLIVFEDVGNGVPKIKFELILRIGNQIQEHKAVITSGGTAPVCNGVLCTYTLEMKDAVKSAGKLTAQVKVSTPIPAAVTSAQSKEFDLAEINWATFVGCDCLDVKDKPSGIYHFKCPDITHNGAALVYSTYCMNSYSEAKGWMLVARIDKSSGNHMKKEGTGGLAFPGKERNCAQGLDTTSGPRDVTPPNLCGATWKLPDTVINELATYRGRSNSVYRLDCAGRTGFWQFKKNQQGSQVNDGFHADQEDNEERYKRWLTDGSWPGFIKGSTSYGYHYAGMCDDKWEEGIGWMAYGFDPDQSGQHKGTYGESKGCLGHTAYGSKPNRGQWAEKDGFLWLTWT